MIHLWRWLFPIPRNPEGDLTVVLTRLQAREEHHGRAIDRANRRALGISLCEHTTRERSRVPKQLYERVRRRLGLDLEVES